jgi:hypothetical protein
MAPPNQKRFRSSLLSRSSSWITEAKLRKRDTVPIWPKFDFEGRPTKETFAATRCKYPWDYLLIRGDGQVRICCGGLPGESGNILEDGFWSVWNGPVRRQMRRSVNTAVIDEDCYYCPLNATRDVNDVETHMRPVARVE